MAYLEVGGMCGSYFTRNRIYPVQESRKAMEDIIRMTNGRDAYYCVYLFSQKDRKEGTRYLAPLYFDLDGDIGTDDGFHNLQFAALSLLQILKSELRLTLGEISVFFSGAKGFHVLVSPSVLEIPYNEHLNLWYKRAALYFRRRIEHGELLDTRIYDSKRLIRIPNTINSKTGLYKVSVTAEQIRHFSRESIQAFARQPKAILLPDNACNQEAATRFRDLLRQIAGRQTIRYTNTPKKIPDREQKLPPCVRILLSTPIEKGGRNNMLAILSSVLVQNGYTGEAALGILEGWNSLNPEPLGEREILATYQSAEKMAVSGRGYGCTSIRAQGIFAPRELCPLCPVFRQQNS